MSGYLTQLVNQHARTGLLIDSGILLLFFIGRVEESLIRRFERTASFESNDFRLLCYLMRQFPQLYTTPNVLTEVSNLGSRLSGDYLRRFRTLMAEHVPSFTETYTPSTTLTRKRRFPEFGLTDASLMEEGEQGRLILTADFALYSVLAASGIAAVNFNHLRPLAWDS